MKISIIVPFLNEEKYIEQCIKSLIDQNFPKNDYEIIFIDNGSHDNSVRIVKKYPQVKLLLEIKPNPYNARNKGLMHAKGEIIAFTDADCQVEKNWLKEINTTFTDQQIYAVLGERNFPNKKDICLQAYADYENTKIEYIQKYFKAINYIGFTNNLAIRKKVFDKTGLLVTNLPVNGDVEIIQRVANQFPGKKIIYSPKLKILHLEISNLQTWFKKLRIYGEHNTMYECKSAFKNLNVSQNLKIYYNLSKRYHIVKKTLVLLLLLGGFVNYGIGKYQYRFKSVFKTKNHE